MELEHKAEVKVIFYFDPEEETSTYDAFICLEEILGRLGADVDFEIINIYDPEPDDDEGNIEAQQIAFQEFEPHD